MFSGLRALIKRVGMGYRIQPSIIYGIIIEYGKNTLNPMTYIEYNNRISDFRVGLARVPYSLVSDSVPDLVYLFNPETNINCCFNIIETELLHCSNIKQAVFVYNSSEEVDKNLYKYDQFTTNVMKNSRRWFVEE